MADLSVPDPNGESEARQVVRYALGLLPPEAAAALEARAANDRELGAKITIAGLLSGGGDPNPLLTTAFATSSDRVPDVTATDQTSSELDGEAF